MSGSTLRVTILGCGSSGGVPRIDGDWGACDPTEPRNRRSRCSLLLQLWRGAPGAGEDATTVLIDTAPELREQMLAAAVRRLDAVIYSHEHADQSHGIDDLRAMAYAMRRRVPVYMDVRTGDVLYRRFGYCFEGAGGYPAILDRAGEVEHGRRIVIEGPGGVLGLEPLIQDHGPITSYGFRFGPAAYSNDVVRLPDKTLERLSGLSLWIVDALRYTPHPTHATVDQALTWARALAPRRTILTNMHVDLDYRTLLATLPAGVEPAHDGLAVDIPWEDHA